jgi:hypothetical protein
MIFIYSLQSEWLKTKRSAASWLCLIGGFFIPLIYLILFLKDHSYINKEQSEIWQKIFRGEWNNMAVFLLPMGVILASSLITQMEYKNNTWKQLHTTPQSFTTIFLSKFSVIALMTVKFFLFFNIGIILSGIIPCLLFDHQLPKEGIPFLFFLRQNTRIFLTCLPILAIQYLISLRFKNFLVAIGVGLLGLVGSLIGASWKYIFLSPYSFSPMLVMPIHRDFNIPLVAFFYFVVLMIVSYILYIAKREKG